VDPTPSRGLRITDQAQFVEKRFEDVDGDRARLPETDAGLRVEVDAEFVGVFDVGTAHLPGMQCDRAHLSRPGDRRRMGDLQRVRGTAGRERHGARLEIVRMLLRDPLLVDLLAVDPVGKPLQMYGPVSQQ